MSGRRPHLRAARGMDSARLNAGWSSRGIKEVSLQREPVCGRGEERAQPGRWSAARSALPRERQPCPRASPSRDEEGRCEQDPNSYDTRHTRARQAAHTGLHGEHDKPTSVHTGPTATRQPADRQADLGPEGSALQREAASAPHRRESCPRPRGTRRLERRRRGRRRGALTPPAAAGATAQGAGGRGGKRVAGG
jgi:hypothetical protein